VRSQHFKPVDILAAADVLRYAIAVPQQPQAKWQDLLRDTRVMRAYLSVLATVVKRAAMAVRTAGRLCVTQDRPQQSTCSEPSSQAQDAAFAAAAAAATQNFPAVITAFHDVLLCNTAKGASLAAEQLQCDPRTAADTDAMPSNKNGGQCMASAALLVVLLVRSLVVLAEAMDAAAAAAGMTPAQLLARCG
jgi:hypothetical protein